MHKNKIIERLESCGYINDSAATQLHQFTTIGRSSLTTQQVDNRNSKGWVRGEYIVASYERDGIHLKELLDGWERIAERYKNQYLIIEVGEGDWRMYDYNCHELGGNEYIIQRFTQRQVIEKCCQKIFYGCPGSGKSHMVNKLVNNTFTKYLSSKGLSDSSCSKYANVLTTLWVVDIAKQCTTEKIESLYDISDIETINKVFNDKVFNEKDDKGQRMYSTALKHYIDYLDSKKYIFRTTFHPDTDYASFVGCYKPMAEGHNGNYRFKSLQDLKAEANIINSSSGDKVSQIVAFVTKYANDLQYIVDTDPNIKSLQNLLNKNLSFANETYLAYVVDYVLKNQETRITYKFCPQVFTNAYITAWEDTRKPVYLIIEEINRGNCAQIFGDLFQLLDRDKTTGKSEYPIKADKDLVAHIEKVLGAGHEGIKNGELCLPPNLIIYATMNTSDQSLFPMDSAFKRRWDWEYVSINYSKDINSGKFIVEIDKDTKYSWVEFLECVNDKIYDATNSEDKQMGNFFIKKSIKANEFVNKVMFYLWNEVCKEEYGTQRNFFRKGKDGKTEFKFTELFGDNQATILKEFMTSLGVEPIGKKPEEPAAE